MQVRIWFYLLKSLKKVATIPEYSLIIDRTVQKWLKSAGTYRKNLSYK